MKTENDLIAGRLQAAVKDALTAKRRANGIMSEASDDLIERVCDEVMITFRQKIGDDAQRFSPEEISSLMRESISVVCARYLARWLSRRAEAKRKRG